MATEILRMVRELAKQVAATAGQSTQAVESLQQVVGSAVAADSDPLQLLEAIHEGQTSGDHRRLKRQGR